MTSVVQPLIQPDLTVIAAHLLALFAPVLADGQGGLIEIRHGPIDPALEKQWADTVLLRRMGIRQEIQGLALLLACDASSFMTGHVHPVDGGAMVGAFGP